MPCQNATLPSLPSFSLYFVAPPGFAAFFTLAYISELHFNFCLIFESLQTAYLQSIFHQIQQTKLIILGKNGKTDRRPVNPNLYFIFDFLIKFQIICLMYFLCKILQSLWLASLETRSHIPTFRLGN